MNKLNIGILAMLIIAMNVASVNAYYIGGAIDSVYTPVIEQPSDANAVKDNYYEPVYTPVIEQPGYSLANEHSGIGAGGEAVAVGIYPDTVNTETVNTETTTTASEDVVVALDEPYIPNCRAC